mmetsp:Transcript_100371/g.283112  ORF Transcript_100371/g.283112 Transcript_100371/m.283112 type:complete len:215 (+) Transcript_100371:285-929(+)
MKNEDPTSKASDHHGPRVWRRRGYCGRELQLATMAEYQRVQQQLPGLHQKHSTPGASTSRPLGPEHAAEFPEHRRQACPCRGALRRRSIPEAALVEERQIAHDEVHAGVCQFQPTRVPMSAFRRRTGPEVTRLARPGAMLGRHVVRADVLVRRNASQAVEVASGLQRDRADAPERIQEDLPGAWLAEERHEEARGRPQPGQVRHALRKVGPPVA